MIYKRLLRYEFKNTASSYGDLRDYEELSDVTLVCRGQVMTARNHSVICGGRDLKLFELTINSCEGIRMACYS